MEGTVGGLDGSEVAGFRLCVAGIQCSVFH